MAGVVLSVSFVTGMKASAAQVGIWTKWLRKQPAHAKAKLAAVDKAALTSDLVPAAVVAAVPNALDAHVVVCGLTPSASNAAHLRSKLKIEGAPRIVVVGPEWMIASIKEKKCSVHRCAEFDYFKRCPAAPAGGAAGGAVFGKRPAPAASSNSSSNSSASSTSSASTAATSSASSHFGGVVGGGGGAEPPAKKRKGGGGGLSGFFTTSGPPKVGWSVQSESVIVRKDPRAKPRAKIAAFDLDGTIVKTVSGSSWAIDGGWVGGLRAGRDERAVGMGWDRIA